VSRNTPVPVLALTANCDAPPFTVPVESVMTATEMLRLAAGVVVNRLIPPRPTMVVDK